MIDIGKCWWDFDENMNVAIECEKPLVGKHYLLTIHTPKHGVEGEATGAIKIAEKIVALLNKR